MLDGRLGLEAASVRCEALTLLRVTDEQAEERFVDEACAMALDELLSVSPHEFERNHVLDIRNEPGQAQAMPDARRGARRVADDRLEMWTP